jgi:hypothetical protein
MDIVPAAPDTAIFEEVPAHNDAGSDSMKSSDIERSASAETIKPSGGLFTVQSLRNMYKERFVFFARGPYSRSAEWLHRKLGLTNL